ncbi:uncharacterized protein LOC132696187 [Cylas formicarius]|uniref:uncharacterized protein LOC132696187 n=1 Tax=Cylas formicarius TaxID=197179 RepID=UPI002958AB0B|nr:uncharacterized protein LOC132696187 [Cylas formicarius]
MYKGKDRVYSPSAAITLGKIYSDEIANLGRYRHEERRHSDICKNGKFKHFRQSSLRDPNEVFSNVQLGTPPSNEANDPKCGKCTQKRRSSHSEESVEDLNIFNNNRIDIDPSLRSSKPAPHINDTTTNMKLNENETISSSHLDVESENHDDQITEIETSFQWLDSSESEESERGSMAESFNDIDVPIPEYDEKEKPQPIYSTVESTTAELGDSFPATFDETGREYERIETVVENLAEDYEYHLKYRYVSAKPRPPNEKTNIAISERQADLQIITNIDTEKKHESVPEEKKNYLENILRGHAGFHVTDLDVYGVPTHAVAMRKYDSPKNKFQSIQLAHVAEKSTQCASATPESDIISIDTNSNNLADHSLTITEPTHVGNANGIEGFGFRSPILQVYGVPTYKADRRKLASIRKLPHRSHAALSKQSKLQVLGETNLRSPICSPEKSQTRNPVDENWKEFLSKLDTIIVNKTAEFI